MMNYVEYLRVMRGLRIVAVIFGLVFLGALILRVSLYHGHTWDDSVKRISSSPTAHVTTVKLPNGSTKTIIDDPAKKTHAEITDRGYAGKEIVITQPSKHGHVEHVTIGSVSVKQSQDNGMEHVTVMTNDETNVGWLMLGSLPWMLLFASLVAGPLAKENDGHLELAWTQPVSRTMYALRAIGIDFAGIVAVGIASCIVYLMCASLFQLPHVTVTTAGLEVVATSILAAFGFYALATAVTSSLKVGPGLIIGVIWAAIAIVPGLARIDGEPGTIWHTVGLAFRTINYLNPLTYVAGAIRIVHDEPTLGGAAAAAPLILIGLTLVYLAAALVQWRRVEA